MRMLRVRQPQVRVDVDDAGQDEEPGRVDDLDAVSLQVGTDALDASVGNGDVGYDRARRRDDGAVGDDEIGHRAGATTTIGMAQASSLISISWAPSQSTRRPISASCSWPLVTVAKWLPASGPTRELKLHAPYGKRISHSLISPV